MRPLGAACRNLFCRPARGTPRHSPVYRERGGYSFLIGITGWLSSSGACVQKEDVTRNSHTTQGGMS